MATEIGAKVYRANGSLFYLDGNTYEIEEGHLTAMVDRQGRRLIAMHGEGVYLPMDERWRFTKAQALVDARDRLHEKATAIQSLVVKAAQAALDADAADREAAEGGK